VGWPTVLEPLLTKECSEDVLSLWVQAHEPRSQLMNCTLAVNDGVGYLLEQCQAISEPGVVDIALCLKIAEWALSAHAFLILPFDGAGIMRQANVLQLVVVWPSAECR
jgi:hypothetical protein